MYRFILPAVLLFASTAALSSDHGYAAKQAAADQVALDKALAGLTPAKPQQCLDLYHSYDTQRIGDTILYKVSRRELYRADTTGGCYGLRRGDAIITSTYGSQLCSGDIVRTVDLVGHFPTGSCTIRAFVPYRAPKKP